MKLFSFLHELLTEGNVTIEGQLSSFDDEDLSDSVQLLKQFYDEDVLEMPAVAPAFDGNASIWAATQLYLSLQLIVLRDISPETIDEKLLPFSGIVTPSAIYSADLVLRFIPRVFELAKGLAPADIMVSKMIEIAVHWPFSSVGMQLPTDADDSIIVAHSSLRTAYADRIVKTKDITRICNNSIKESILEALGNYASVLWPEFFELLSNNQHAT